MANASMSLEMSKKIDKLIKLRKLKKIIKKTESKKNWIN